MKTINIKDLVQRVKRQDMLAMKVLYEQYSREMLGLSYRITQNKADAEDIIQEAFLKSFQEIRKLKEAEKYPAWLKRIVLNRSLSTIKGKIHFAEIDNIAESIEDEDQEHWYEGIPFEKIKPAIQELPDGCRQVFTLYLLEDYKHREIAELLDISLSNSKSQYRYALKLLKEKLSKLIL